MPLPIVMLLLARCSWGLFDVKPSARPADRLAD
jgi:hypothetical protein